MLITAVIVAFFLGAIVTLLLQFWITHRWLSYQPSVSPPYKQQHHKIQLPQVLSRTLPGFAHRSSIGKDTNARPETSGKIPTNSAKDTSLILNVLSHFLFAELKDTARVRRWMSRKLNVEFDEMLSSNAGKLMNQIQVRDFSFGESFPLVETLELKEVELSKDKESIEKVDVALEVDYGGGFQLTLDVDVIFGAWAYLYIKVTKLSGLARLQLSRTPFTHWSFSFYDEPEMEFEVDSRFNGRPIPQISSLIINQIKRAIRKKHILPSYKMRYKPLFVKPEDSYVNPDIYFHGNKLGRGQLTVKVLRCSRLQEMSKDSKLYCALSVDKESMEDVWRKSWQILHITLKITPSRQLGIALKDQLSGEKTEKKRVVIDSITPESPAAEAGLRKGDIIEYINNVRVLSFKHAMKQLKTSVENIELTIRRYKSRFALDEDQQFPDQEPLLDLEVEEQETELDGKDDLSDFVTISVKDNTKTTNTSNTSNSIASATKLTESQKLSDKFSRKFQSGKRKILSIGGNGKDSGGVNLEASANEGLVQNGDGRGDEEFEVADGPIGPVTIIKDGSHSASSSPLRQVKAENRQRALSDTSLNRASDSEGSLLSESGCYGYQTQERRAGEVLTRDLDFTRDPEWNEEFEFDCREEDQFVNVCVWCKVIQSDRTSKQMTSSVKSDAQAKNTPPTDELPFYNITTKIGYASIPLSDITAGCLLTLQGDTQYTVYLQPPEETITATRAKMPFSSHAGYDKSLCQGDITLSFMHTPFKTVDNTERKVIVNKILNPKPVKLRTQSVPKQTLNGQHSFQICHFQSATYCDFCGKKIWLKGGMHCIACSMVSHKKCVEKCHLQTKCSRDGPKNAFKPDEPWLPPLKSKSTGAQGDQDREEKDVRAGMGAGGKFWKSFRTKDQPSLPLNIPNKMQPGKISPSPSPSKSPMRSPSPFSNILGTGEGHLSVMGIKKVGSNKSLSGMDKDEDSDDDMAARYRQHSNYSLDDHIVMEAKEKGKELYSELSLPERKKTLDEMVTKLQDTIDKESEYKSDLLRSLCDSNDTDQKRMITQQLDKCDEKMDALMMMMVHYCAGLQHCLDQEEAHKRLMDLKQEVSVGEETGIQFIVTDTQSTE